MLKTKTVPGARIQASRTRGRRWRGGQGPRVLKVSCVNWAQQAGYAHLGSADQSSSEALEGSQWNLNILNFGRFLLPPSLFR